VGKAPVVVNTTAVPFGRFKLVENTPGLAIVTEKAAPENPIEAFQ
jgi:hypothetical protein